MSDEVDVRITAMALVGMAAASLAQPVAWAAPRPEPTCASFMQDYPKALSGLRVSFERPLTITRDLFGGDDGIEVHILSTNVDVDGTLKCKGDEIRRFEVRISAPAEAGTLTNFARFEQVALTAIFGWERAKAETVVNAMSADAAEYLHASIQRGDTYNAGKVEYHQGGRYGLGLIWTESDHTFVITSQVNN
jgi:hypothetical protein